jgi:AAA domain
MTQQPQPSDRPELRLAPDRLEFGRDGVPWPTMPMDQTTGSGHGRSNGNGHRPPDLARPFVPVDLAELARSGVPAPELVCHGLLYRGGLHSLAGPPDAGKSTLLYLWALELLAQGERVVLLDEESGREQVTEKLLALGATPDLLDPDRLVYQDFPGRTWDGADHQALADLLEHTRPALVGLDSAGAFLAVAGLSENESEHVTGFYKAVLLNAARTFNTAVVVLDHQGKADEAGRYARGSGAKLALVDVHLRVEAVVPFSRSQSGLLKLLVHKDRRGYLHRAHEIAVNVDPNQGALALAFTQVEHTAGPDGSRAEEFSGDPAATEPALADLPPATRKLLVVLREAEGQPLTRRELVDRVKARWNHGLTRQTVSAGVNELAKRGLADGEQGDDGRDKRWWIT